MEIVKNSLDFVFNNKYSATVVTIILISYAALTRPELPKPIIALFENPIFRIFILSLIVYRGNKDPRFSIIVATGFTIIMDIISKKKIFDTFTNVNDVDDSYDMNTPPMDTPKIDSDYIDGNKDDYVSDVDTDSNTNSDDNSDDVDNLKPEEEEDPKLEDELLQEEEGMCRELPDGTDTCEDDMVCDNGRCIDAT